MRVTNGAMNGEDKRPDYGSPHFWSSVAACVLVFAILWVWLGAAVACMFGGLIICAALSLYLRKR